jgi:hypothetical protein
MTNLYIRRGQSGGRGAFDLLFPNECACCGAVPVADHMYIAHKKLEWDKLKIPYCSKHAKILTFHKVLSIIAFLLMFMTAFAVSLPLAIWAGTSHTIGRYGSTLGAVIVIAGLVTGAIASTALSSVVGKWINKLSGDTHDLDENGAVTISAVATDSYTLSFKNKEYSAKFLAANSGSQISLDDATTRLNEAAAAQFEPAERPTVNANETTKGASTVDDEEDPFP